MRPAMIVSAGGIAMDVLMRVPRLPSEGECVRASSAHHGAGGKGANQAVAAARLGGDVALVGAVGGDAAGELVLRHLADEGVRVDAVQRLREHATGMVVMQTTADGRKLAAVHPGANAHVTRAVIDACAEVIRNARVVMVQLEIPLDTALHVASMAHDAGARVILDPSPIRDVPQELLRRARVVRCNAREATRLTNIEVRDVSSARHAAARLLELGAQLAAIEAGSDGNLFVTRDEEILVPLHDVDSMDAMGAGDALTGALAVAIAESMPLRDAAEFATAAAALTTRALGAQVAMPRREEVEALVSARASRRRP